MMTFRRPAVVMTLLLGLTLAGCEGNRQAPAVPGNPAPAFSLTDLEGRSLRLSDLRGSVVVLDFWATWCGPCRRSMPEFERLWQEYRGRKVVVIGISLDKGGDAAANVRAFATEKKVTYRMAIDDGSVSKAYGIVRLPATVILDQDHVIRETYPGYRPGLGREIAGEIDKLLTPPASSK
jgi:peroxiredoxin